MPYIDPAIPTHAAFKKSYPQACENFENDAELNDEQKLKFVAHLEAAGTSDLGKYLNVFFYDHKNQVIGSDVTLENGERLGCVRTLTSFARRITECSAQSIDGDAEYAEEFVRNLAVASVSDLQELLADLFPGRTNITLYTMWSFRNPNCPQHPTGLSTNDLPCRLGLRDFEVEEYVLFGHSLPSNLKAHLPTFFEAGIEHEQWRPGGKTEPFPKCKNKENGLPEVVHKPNIFNSITAPLIIITP